MLYKIKVHLWTYNNIIECFEILQNTHFNINSTNYRLLEEKCIK